MYKINTCFKTLLNSFNRPGTYTPFKQRQSISFNHSFGGRVQMRLPVEIKCCSRNTDVCKICDERPIGDYWHRDNKVFVCRPCMIEERRNFSIFTKQDLSQFHVIIIIIIIFFFSEIKFLNFQKLLQKTFKT